MYDNSGLSFALLSNRSDLLVQKNFYGPVAARRCDESRAPIDLSRHALPDQASCNVWSTETDKLDTIKRIAEPVRVVEQVPADAARLIAAGRQDLLIAHQKALLHVLHCAS